MLAALVLAGIIAAPVGTIALLVKGSGRVRDTGAWPPVRRFATAVGGTLLLGGLVIGVLRLLGVTERNAIVGAAAMAAASLAWLPVTRRWNARGHLCWSTTIFLFVVYLALVLDWTLESGLGPAGTAGGRLLWLFIYQPARAGPQRTARHGAGHAQVAAWRTGQATNRAHSTTRSGS